MEAAVLVSRILIWVLAIMLGFKLIKGIELRLIGIGYVLAMTLRDFDEEASDIFMDELCKKFRGLDWFHSFCREKAPDYSRRIRAKTAVFNEEEDS